MLMPETESHRNPSIGYAQQNKSPMSRIGQG